MHSEMTLKFFKGSFAQNIYRLLKSVCLGYLVQSSALPHLKNLTSSEPENILCDKRLHSPLSTSDSDSRKASNRSNATSTDLLEECRSLPLSPHLWQELGLNEFLLNYPGGEFLNLQVDGNLLNGLKIFCHPFYLWDYKQLADRVNLTNFECGIGKPCYADQLCQPVRGKEWCRPVNGSIKYKLSDFYPDSTHLWDILKAYSSLISAAIKVYPTCGLLSSTRYWYQFIQGEFGMLYGISGMMDDVLFKKHWNCLSYKISEKQQLAQMAVANISHSTIESGISTIKGIYRVLKDGRFLVDDIEGKFYSKNPMKNLIGDKQEEMRLSAQLQILAALWIEQHPCMDSGLNGAWPGGNVLSYCGPDDIMMNIVQADGNQEIRKVHNAHLISQKYNLSVGYLTQVAWECYKSGKQSDYGSWESWGRVSEESDYPCSFNLPVCDLTRPDIQQHKNRRGIVVACRITGQLPI
ncbi:uncharacterized protein MELLADRAFT_110698 [Melampsora larici-populina 98AG31]|uniref:DUF7872 domain-containing protein n=1 Tax=Melampsora larici-populina (strain 98AG31 / pathotype 3-4-7) TaxID=747676 RepID=F4S0N4_MELLP|nr:uncharacterized protein MELLADRAFT_110698 [Melampsora larici-populina 98AG31]EGG01835.1 hypothetical protein MELLADRAFT_110698 [Melampsora larici-populina 98AG31]